MISVSNGTNRILSAEMVTVSLQTMISLFHEIFRKEDMIYHGAQLPYLCRRSLVIPVSHSSPALPAALLASPSAPWSLYDDTVRNTAVQYETNSSSSSPTLRYLTVEVLLSAETNIDYDEGE